MLTDYFIAFQAELTKLDIRSSPASTHPGVQAKGADTVKLATLQRILAMAVDQPELSTLHSSLVNKPTAEGPWVFAVAPAVTQALARLTVPEVHDVALEWVETREWRLDRGDEQTVTDLLSGLQGLAQRARAEGKEIFLWMSL